MLTSPRELQYAHLPKGTTVCPPPQGNYRMLTFPRELQYAHLPKGAMPVQLKTTRGPDEINVVAEITLEVISGSASIAFVILKRKLRSLLSYLIRLECLPSPSPACERILSRHVAQAKASLYSSNLLIWTLLKKRNCKVVIKLSPNK